MLDKAGLMNGSPYHHHHQVPSTCSRSAIMDLQDLPLFLHIHYILRVCPNHSLMFFIQVILSLSRSLFLQFCLPVTIFGSTSLLRVQNTGIFFSLLLATMNLLYSPSLKLLHRFYVPSMILSTFFYTPTSQKRVRISL